MKRAVNILATRFAPVRTSQAKLLTASWNSRILKTKKSAVIHGTGSNAEQELFDELCASDTAVELIKEPYLRHTIFVVDPKPSIDVSVQLLPYATRSDYWICLRTAIYRNKFVESFKIIDIYPESLQLSVIPFAIGLASSTPWLPTLVAPIIAGCWIGLAVAAFNDPKLRYVRWKSNVKWKYRLLNGTQLRMANALVEHYEELPRKQVKHQGKYIATALKQRGIEVLRGSSLYGEYWGLTPSTSSNSKQQHSSCPEYSVQENHQ